MRKISVLLLFCIILIVAQANDIIQKENKIESSGINLLHNQPTLLAQHTTYLEEQDTPIVSLPEHELYLYAKDEGVLLQYKQIKEFFEWTYTTPRQILPDFNVHDYDNDGQEEIAVKLHIGSGTGVAIDELHIIEISNDESTLIDLVFTSEDYKKNVSNDITLKKMNKDGSFLGYISILGHDYEFSLTHLKEIYGEDNIADELAFGSITSFELIDNQIIYTTALGVMINEIAEPQYIGELKAVVNYTDEDFYLNQYSFYSYEQ